MLFTSFSLEFKISKLSDVKIQYGEVTGCFVSFIHFRESFSAPPLAHRNSACNNKRMTGVEKYSYHEIRGLFDNGSLGDIQKVSEEIGLDTVVRRDKWTLLHVASATNRRDITQYLINMGSDVNVLDKEGKSPLYYCKSEEVAKMMVDAGADVNRPSVLGKTPLHHVCISDATPGAVKILLQSGARANAEDKFGDTPFLYACGMAYFCINEEEFAQNLPKIKMLLEYGADIHHVNSKGENGLHVCSRYGACEVVEILTKHGVEVNALNMKRQTPLATACTRAAFALHGQQGILTTLELLLEHGADPMIPDEQGLTPLHVLMLQLCSSIDIASFVEVLVRCGASMNARDDMLRTPVHYASYATAHRDWPKKLKELMSFGADVNLQDVEGFTAVHVTTIRDPRHLTTFPWPWDCIDETENVVQEINWNCARKQGVTLAHMVLSQKGLTLQGCKVPWDVNARDEFGSTPLHYAEFSNNTIATSYLEVSFTRADATIKNCLGESPIDCAVSALNQEMLSLLQRYGETPAPEKEKRLPDISCKLCACFTNEGRGNYYQPFEKQEELISVDPEEIQINPARKMEEYLSHVLHTPRMGKVPLHDSEVVQIHQETENLIRQILQKVADQDRRFRSTLILSGSVREKTKAGLPNEFDFMCNLELFSSCCKVIDEDTCSPGFVHLEGTDADSANIAEFFDADGFLVPYLVRSKFEQIVRVVMFDSKLWKCCRICSNFILPSLDTGISHPKPSIIIELCWNGPIYKNMVYSVDLVPVIDAGLFWPQNAISTSRVLENIPKQCLFAMTIPRFERGVYGNEVRISFSLIESAIFDSIPEVVKDAYIAAKAVREVCPTLVNSEEVFYNKANLDAQSLIPSFWLKMALLHVLDRYGLDDGSSLTMWVRRIYEKIHHFVCDDEVFPSFFIPQQDFVASYLKGSDLKTSFAGEELEKKFMACKKMCRLIQRFLSSDE